MGDYLSKAIEGFIFSGLVAGIIFSGLVAGLIWLIVFLFHHIHWV
jgi:hypothetical protein